MKITVVGLGYVGLSVAVLLSKSNHVTGLDILPQRIAMIQDGKSPISDHGLEKTLAAGNLDLCVTTDAKKAMTGADFVLIATPTRYCDTTGSFDMSSVESVAEQALEYAPNATLVIKSTVPIGYTEDLSRRCGKGNILFSPEFVREGFALEDNLFPSRIIVGAKEGDLYACEKAHQFAALMASCAEKEDIPIMIMGLCEAEAIKLFSNSYLALRIGFFNEVDTFAQCKGLEARQIIKGISMDPRIGDYYNNPSFGYGGTYLPKDVKQLLGNYTNIPQALVGATVHSNNVRIQFIANQIRDLLAIKRGWGTPTLGVYRLSMKSNSDSIYESAVLKVLDQIKCCDYRILIYEPSVQFERTVEGYEVCRDLDVFKKASELIIANRWDESLSDVWEKVYSRDLFHYN